MQNKSNITVIPIYIPRMLGNINKKQIVDAFNDLNIGYTSNIEMYKRQNIHNHTYYFTFLNLQLYKTSSSTNFYNELINNGKLNLNYDKFSSNYWEVKQHIPRAERNYKNTQSCNKSGNKESNCIENLSNPIQNKTTKIYSIWSDFTNIFGTTYNDPFTEQDKTNILDEFEELNIEIFYSNSIEHIV
jgi:type II secretory pathway pseudopilin PulG